MLQYLIFIMTYLYKTVERIGIGLLRAAIIFSSTLCILSGCNKLVDIPAPANSITTSQVFSDSADAAAAISGIYSNIAFGTEDISFCNGMLTLFCGMSADEIIPLNSNVNYVQIYTNNLQFNTALVSYLWSLAYFPIYQTNACIEGISESKDLTASVKNRFIGESKFLRALFYFYLVNIYGDIPFVTSTDWANTQFMLRTPKEQVYQKIIDDLKDAQRKLSDDYSFSQSQRTRANKWAATALLARVYLYMQDWANAELQSSAVIEGASSLFYLESDLRNVFLTSSSEAILQWQLNTNFAKYNATPEGYNIIPPSDHSSPPGYYVTPQLLSSFEFDDRRKEAWIDSMDYASTRYYFPRKYKVGRSEATFGGNPTEYYTVLRLAEQYLIRSEARAQHGNLVGAIEDLNLIRNRAGLPSLTFVTKDQVLSAIAHERRIELFAEWGHRWLDLKRTGQIDAVMSVVTPNKNGGGRWMSYQQLYPIPQDEIDKNYKLTQNPGY